MKNASNRIKDDIQLLHGVGTRRAEAYRRLGVTTLSGLIRYYPRAYLDFSACVPIADTVLNEVNTIRGTVYRKQPEQRIRKGLSLFRVYVTDGERELVVTIFNSKFMYDALELEKTYLFHGKVTGNFLRREMNAPLFIPETEPCRLQAVYPQTEGLSSKIIRHNVREALDLVGSMVDPLPDALREAYQLCTLSAALENIHFPFDQTALDASRQRLIFEELLTLQLGLIELKGRSRQTTGVRLERVDLSAFINTLPFALTGAQRRAIDEALLDMRKEQPMNRLLQGDVGSGKTMVAAALAYACAQNGYQTALMAPTEILAEQHYRTLSRTFAPLGINVCLLTGGMTPKQKSDTKTLLREGGYSVAVGTHALLQDTTGFARLGLVITDEQHRFGVEQRSRLTAKGDNPHVLVMSATPIPRTLALIIYGDLDVSVLDELPAGRQPIETYVVGGSKRIRAFGFIKKFLDQGQQAYIVCPLIEEGDSGLAAAEHYAAALKREVFGQYRVGLLHGRMKPAEKDAVMQAFQSGEIQLLVSTTVIEVGVDVPNAVVMLIENAERFGLSQLHQLRGRVGRGSEQSYCILVSDADGEETRRRLRVMKESNDGFRIAEEDLKLRGPGDFFGSRQHGLPQLRIADMAEDMAVLQTAQTAARNILAADPGLQAPENQGLRSLVDELFANSLDGGMN